MKNPQGREAKKPKKSKAKIQAKAFENTVHKSFQAPKSEVGDRPNEN